MFMNFSVFFKSESWPEELLQQMPNGGGEEGETTACRGDGTGRETPLQSCLPCWCQV